MVLAVGARDRTRTSEWGGYTVDEAAIRHGAGVEQETADWRDAYAGLTPRAHAGYREGWLSK